MASNLGKDSDIIHNKNFENGIVEIQDGEENNLNVNEGESVKKNLTANNNSCGEEEMTMDNEDSFVDSTLKAALEKKKKQQNNFPQNTYRLLLIFVSVCLVEHL